MRSRLSALLHQTGTQGVIAAASWASALCGSATFMHRVAGIGDQRGSLLPVFSGLEALAVWVPLAGAAGLPGAWIGSRTRGAHPAARVVGIALTLLAGGALTIVLILWLWGVAHALTTEGPLKALSSILGLPVLVMLVLGVGLPPFLPVLALPVIGAAVLIEGSTRGAERSGVGLVDGVIRRTLITALLVGTLLTEGTALLIAR